MSLYIAVIILFQTVWLIRFLNKTNRKIAFFFNAIENNDSTINFPYDIKTRSIRELNSSLNRVNKLLQEAKINIKEQEQYYQTILEEAETGILVLNGTGHIIHSNKTARQLLNYPHLTHIQQLQPISESLFQTLQKQQSFDQKLIQIPNERESIHLTAKARKLILKEENLLIVVIQNIHKELDNQEVESWQRLIRVLTHEIMNSVAPITSISETLLGYFKKDGELVKPASITQEKVKQAVKALDTINYQGSNLMKFTDSYRTLTKIPEPDKKLLNVRSIFETVRILVSQEDSVDRISFKTTIAPKELEVYADEKLITLVLLNLIKNAIHSLADQDNGQIELSGEKDELGRLALMVSDNGPGISPCMLQKIFVPFFTTKKDGSGIGLSLSKHIMKLHHGSIEVKSKPQVKTIFSLHFQQGLG
ncbi:PAS domain-containing protein [Echinicola sp. CAU 1574]|uniref:histidine kinase n=1 Tax=Echinicola arenosa TaxID=2774144 RepID=A0ABR9AKC2_9BACT|nr:ATP-binding protein [Echinicola arenosa]MBD8488268.1 PAS domain-containing protein [Echinicola arenosa]